MREQTWTPERLAALQQAIDEGLTFKAIGARLGLTKNQCLCKATRMGFKPALPEILSKAQQLAREYTKPETSTLSRLAALDVFPGHGNCVFPIGHPGTDGFHFCGTPVADIGSPYCGSCGSKAFTAPPRTGMEAGWSDERKAKHRAMMLARHRA